MTLANAASVGSRAPTVWTDSMTSLAVDFTRGDRR